jgi:hypothetical protein
MLADGRVYSGRATTRDCAAHCTVRRSTRGSSIMGVMAGNRFVGQVAKKKDDGSWRVWSSCIAGS